MRRGCTLALLSLFQVGALQAAWLEVGEERILGISGSLGVPQAAYGSGIYLLVWREGWPGMGGDADILGLRLRADSLQPVDPRPIKVGSSPGAQDRPAVAYADGAFLVVWEDFQNGRDADICAAYVSPQTGLVTQAVLRIATGPANQARPHVSASSAGFFIVWQEGDEHGTYQIRGRRILPSGDLPEQVRVYATKGASPRVSSNGSKVLVSWTTGTSRGVVSAGLLAAASGEVEKSLGVINSCCPDGLGISSVANGDFWVVSARESYPNPWGWPGPGAVTFSRVLKEGSTPEADLDYGRRLTRLSERTVPNVVDAATWGTSGVWNAGVPGGFPGTKDGLWPHGMPSIAHDGQGNVLLAWVKGLVGNDRLSLSNFDIWVAGFSSETLQKQFEDEKVAGETEVDELLPFLVSNTKGEILLLYLKVGREIQRQLVARKLILNQGG